MNNLQKLRLWEHLKKDFLQNIKDNNTRKLYYKTLLIKATKEFGFNPENGDIQPQDNPELTDWEQDLLEDIKTFKDYDIDVRGEKRKETDESFRKAMREYVALGNTYEDIPDDIKCETIRQAYYEEVRAKLDRINFQIADLEDYAKKHNIQLDKTIIGEFKC